MTCLIAEKVGRQRCCLCDFLGREVVAFGFGTEALAEGRLRFGGLELPSDAEHRHQVLRASLLEFENVGVVVAHLSKQLVPHRPFTIESPAAQCLEADLPTVGEVLFGHHGVVHLFLQNR